MGTFTPNFMKKLSGLQGAIVQAADMNKQVLALRNRAQSYDIGGTVRDEHKE